MVDPARAVYDSLNSEGDLNTFIQGEVENLYVDFKTKRDHTSPLVDIPPKGTVSFRQLLKDVVFEKQIEHSGELGTSIELIELDENDSSFVDIDQCDFRAVLSNIINNAVESYPGKSGSVKIEISANSKLCTTRIIDNGVGIPKDVLVQIGLKEISLKDDGKGLGLIHATKTIKKFSGEIFVESEEGFGTSVTITLPKVAANRAQAI